MGYSKDTTYLNPLKIICTDVDPQLRREALTALVKLGSPFALEDVKKMLSDPDQTVALAASEAYRQFTGDNARSKAKKTAPIRRRIKPE